MTGVAVFTAYCSSVPSMFLNCGSPSYLTCNWASLRVMMAVCGMAVRDQRFLGGPGSRDRHQYTCLGTALGNGSEVSGKFFPSTNSQGPVSKDFDRNHRPAEGCSSRDSPYPEKCCARVLDVFQFRIRNQLKLWWTFGYQQFTGTHAHVNHRNLASFSACFSDGAAVPSGAFACCRSWMPLVISFISSGIFET